MIQRKSRRIVFLTGTRADFGKMKALLQALDDDGSFEILLFVTGMHLLSRYGSTWEEVRATGIGHVYTFINQNHDDRMEAVFAKTVTGFSDYIRETQPDLVVVHGDRVETLAGATVGALAGLMVAHIEGGEVSGTVDEIIRHAVTKLAHLHFVSNDEALRRVLQLGESPRSVHIIGSPDIDVMGSEGLPDICEVRRYYEIPFDDYGILIFHPVTTELGQLQSDVTALVDFVLSSSHNYIVILPNNDAGTHLIVNEYRRFDGMSRIRMFPSMRFEYFLTALRFSRFIIGNSSAGVREAPHFGVPAINVGTRQFRRSDSPMVVNAELAPESLAVALAAAESLPRITDMRFGRGNSAALFLGLMKSSDTWTTPLQKLFNDRP